MIDHFLHLKGRVEGAVKRLRLLSVVSRQAVNDIRILHCDYKSGSDLPDVQSAGQPFASGDLWGGQADDHFWFYFEKRAESLPDGTQLYLELSTQLEDCWEKTKPQFLVYVNGGIAQGADSNHTLIALDADKPNKIHVYAYTGTHFEKKINFFANYVVVNKEINRLYYNLRVPLDVLEYSYENTGEYYDTLQFLNDTVSKIDFEERSETFESSVKRANRYIEEKFYKSYCGKGADSRAFAACVGHTHIDVAWLWTMRQTREKAQRSFATAVALLEEYPEYKFFSSQPFLYRAVKEEAPELYAKIRKFVREGRWEADGAMWVEADCNLPSGESLVRQILFGKSFFFKEFGKDCKILWLPDVFGYSAALPQILRLSGIEYFVTSKISWNDTDTMPNDTFLWQGLDGSRVFAYFLTAQEMRKDRSIERYATYNATGSPSQIAGAWNGYKNKELSDTVLVAYGHGDGGGGPTRDDLEMIKRQVYGIPNCPKTYFSSAADFLQKARSSAEKSGRMQKWVGEIYFEFHRGTLTSQAANKKMNRKAEFLIQNAELLESICSLYCGKKYRKELLDEVWLTLLNNQFHDVLPGSAIRDVYIDSDRDYRKIFCTLRKIISEDLRSLAELFALPKGGYLVFNPNHFTCDGIIDTEKGKALVKAIPPKGFRAVSEISAKNSIRLGSRSLENRFYRILFDENYFILSIFDKRYEREVVRPHGRANVLTVYEDYPTEYDAWELKDYYVEKGREVKEALSAETFSDGCSAGLRVGKKFGNSVIRQTIRIYEDIERIDFETECDWQENHSVLRTLFPLDINAESATFDIQFGHLERPTHANTSWDRAKFESCGHKFVDISENGYGVALLNDCKYGHSVYDNVLGLTLLRSPSFPDPSCDRGKHAFTYALFPHGSDPGKASVEKMSYILNNGLQVCKAGGGGERTEFSFVSCSDGTINIPAVKLSEDGNAYIVRLVETNNSRHDFLLRFAFPIKEAYSCDLMENPLGPVAVADNSIRAEIGPFKILTYKVYL